MEDSFRVRVDKVFGSLSGPSSATPWTLSDEEIFQKKGASYRSSSPEKLDDDVVISDGKETGDESDLVREIRSSVGLDSTLDYEEEEDEFDKVALGLEVEEEDSCDRLYMRDMDLGYGIDVELPDSFDQGSRDPRANHSAARVRLMEDADFNLPYHPKPILKPILKNREGDKSSKRVRFHHQSLASSPHVDQACDESVENHKSDDPTLPDYLRNPTRYTRYTLDSSNDLDAATNRKAYMDLFNLLNKKREEVSASQHPLTFTPRNKNHSASFIKEDELKPGQSKFVSLSVAATVARDDEDCVMDDIELETAEDDKMDDIELETAEDDKMVDIGMETVRANKRGRHYRMRTVLDSDTAP